MKKYFSLMISILSVMVSFVFIENVYAADEFCGIELSDKVVVTIKFETNGGTEIKDLNYCMDCGVTHFKLPTPKRKGFIFEGWYADRNFKNKISVPFEKNKDAKLLSIVPDSIGCDVSKVHTTLYAKWTSDSECSDSSSNITINFETNGGKEISPIKICENCNSELMSLPTPVRDGYTFLGWYSQKDLLNKIPSEMVKPEEISENMKLEDDNDDKCSFDRHGTIYARWIDKDGLERLIKDSIDNNLYFLKDIVSNNI